MQQLMRVVRGGLAEDGKGGEKDRRTEKRSVTLEDKMEFKPQMLLEGFLNSTTKISAGSFREESQIVNPENTRHNAEEETEDATCRRSQNTDRA